MLSEQDIIDRHKQALGEAHRACQNLAKHADPDHVAWKGPQYTALKAALDRLEGSCRQIGTWRGDARWVRLGAVYGRTRISIQSKFVGQKWGYFKELMALFELGKRRLEEMDAKTGVLGPILPQRASEWLWMPPVRPAGGLH